MTTRMLRRPKDQFTTEYSNSRRLQLNASVAQSRPPGLYMVRNGSMAGFYADPSGGARSVSFKIPLTYKAG